MRRVEDAVLDNDDCGCGGGVRSHAERGFTLMELTIALVLSALVLALVGSLFVASLSTWRRGSNLRQAQIQANALVDVMARDIRTASQAPSVTIRPQLNIPEGETILSISSAGPVGAPGGAGGEAVWILYVRVPERGEVVREIVSPGPAGRVTVKDTRVVATGVDKIEVEQAGNGVTIAVEVRRGRETAASRATAAPMNP